MVVDENENSSIGEETRKYCGSQGESSVNIGKWKAHMNENVKGL